MTKTETYDKVNDVNYRIDEIDQARERIAGRFRRKIELVTDINQKRAELNMLEMQDATDRYLIRELNKSPYSSLKAYFKMEQRPQQGLAN